MTGISIQNLGFGYAKSGLLFENLRLELGSGQIVGLFGKNGAGKTSLLRILAGLVFPLQGQCDVLGYEPRRRLPAFLADIYLIPEDFFVPEMTAQRYEYLYAPFYPKFDSQQFFANLAAFELPADKTLSTLSFGQRKKFLIAFGLATRCRLLLLDEPTHHLDIPSKSQFRKLLAAALTEEQIVIISTHQVKDMENLIDTLILVDTGKILFQQSLESISQHLVFERCPNLPDKREFLFADKDLGGYNVIYKNDNHREGMVDIEVLFNAIIANPEKINAVFKSEVNHVE